MQLNGADQYIVLENSLSDMKDIEIQASVRWDGGAANQRLFNFGSSQDKYMYLTPADETGKVRFEIRNGTSAKTIVGDAPLPVGSWSDVRIVLSGDTGVLYINNNVVAVENDIDINPEDLSAPNVNTQSNCNFIGRGVLADQPFFKGAVDSFYVYFKPVDAVLPTPKIKPTSTPTPVATPTSTLVSTPTSTSNNKEYTVSGYITQDFTSSVPSIKSSFKAEIMGTGLFAPTDNNGYFGIKSVPANSQGYTVRISKAGYLYRDIKNVKVEVSDIGIGSISSPIILWAGDINGDGTINMTDII